jgi:hypothetical protein
MRKFLILVLIVPIFLLYGFTSVDKCDLSQGVNIALLSPYIEKAINEHYGDKIVIDYKGQPSARQIAFYDAKIENISKIESAQNQFLYEIKVSVPTFHGAHNEPYAIEKMTFCVALNDEPKPINYESVQV